MLIAALVGRPDVEAEPSVHLPTLLDEFVVEESVLSDSADVEQLEAGEGKVDGEHLDASAQDDDCDRQQLSRAVNILGWLFLVK